MESSQNMNIREWRDCDPFLHLTGPVKARKRVKVEHLEKTWSFDFIDLTFPSSQEKQLLQKSCKTLAINTMFAKFLWKIHLAKFLRQSCNTFAFLAKILQEFFLLQKIQFLQESCKILQEINYFWTHYVLIIYAFHQKASIINR